MPEFVTVAKLADLEAGTCKIVEAGGKALALFNVGGTIYAVDNTCLHRGGPLGEGILEGSVVTCPWHLWEYDVCTGERVGSPEIKLGTYPVEIEGDDIKIGI